MSSYKPKQSTSDRAGWIKRFGLQVVEGREAFDAREDRGLTWFFKVCTGQKMSENSALVRQIFKGLFLYKRGVRNALNLLVEEHEWALPHLQAPCSLLHLSDLHFLPGHPLAKAVVEKLDDVKADACVITGDYRFPLEGEIETAMEGMRAIREALPETSICILGNHDSLDMVARLEALGYTVLVNESMALRPDLHVVGVDDPTSYRTDDLPKALAGVSDNVARILLSHTCENFVEAAEAGFDLHLSGHTHGGQVCLPGGRPLIHNLPVPRHMNAGRWAHESMQGLHASWHGDVFRRSSISLSAGNRLAQSHSMCTCDTMNAEDIEFPVNITIRIIARDEEAVATAIETKARELNLIGPITQGNQSSSGKYVTHHIDATFTDLQHMRDTFSALGSVDGVRMVL